ncbi:hypothetical protein [Candidatus Phytoplasma australasiaticum]|uniref:hypothetical protein n=1 Tax=Candidatus Phytoplasma australasiaticum TaxID=2754999 RepID=UPI003B984A72
MDFHGASDVIKCRAFFFTLIGPAKLWFGKMKRRSIVSFKELARAFTTQFLGVRDKHKPQMHLQTVRQEPDESLWDYIACFNDEALQVKGCSDEATLISIVVGLQDEGLLNSIGKSQPHFMSNSFLGHRNT